MHDSALEKQVMKLGERIADRIVNFGGSRTFRLSWR
jgi:hypothetical protein